MFKILLCAYDNSSYVAFFPLHLAYLAASLKRNGHEVEIYHQDLTHAPDEHLISVIDAMQPDVVGLGIIAGYWQYRKAISISKAVNASKYRSKLRYVLGGHGPGAAPEYFLEKCGADQVVIGDGEIAIMNNKDRIIDGGRYRPSFWPDYDAFPIEIYSRHRFPNSQPTDFTMPVLSGRGCPYACKFCYRMTKGFWPREAADVMEEISFLNKRYGINHVQLADELLMSSKARAVEFSEAIMRLPFKIKWDCNGRLNYAEKEVLDVMKRSGCSYVNYGVEAIDNEVLRLINKHLDIDTIHRGVEATIAAGITPGLNLMWGNPGDNLQTLQKAVDFLLKYDGVSELRTIRPVTPYPGSALFDLAVEEGMIYDVADFYENKHTNSDLFTVSFMPDISVEKANKNLMVANEKLVSAYYGRCAVATNAKARAFYLGENKEFRGFRPV